MAPLCGRCFQIPRLGPGVLTTPSDQGKLELELFYCDSGVSGKLGKNVPFKGLENQELARQRGN